MSNPDKGKSVKLTLTKAYLGGATLTKASHEATLTEADLKATLTRNLGGANFRRNQSKIRWRQKCRNRHF